MDKKSHFLDESCQSWDGNFSFAQADRETDGEKKTERAIEARPVELPRVYSLSNYYSGELVLVVQAPPVAL